jgi:hypothetical protein
VSVQQLAELQRHAGDYLSRDGRMAADELFFAEQNAHVAVFMCNFAAVRRRYLAGARNLGFGVWFLVF